MTNIDNAINAAIRAGNVIMEIYNDPDHDFSIERKADNSPITIADKKSHQIIVEGLKDTGLPILSEEGKVMDYNSRKNWTNFWLVDPLDGTKEFIKRNGEFTVNIACVKNGFPEMGIIYVPVTKMLYVGINSVGAWKFGGDDENITFTIIKKNGILLPINNKPGNYTVAGSRSHMNKETTDYIAELERRFGQINVITAGSSLKLCMVAEGTVNEYPRFGPTMEWDTAAGHAIVAGAGKKLYLTDFSNELYYNKQELTNPNFIAR